MPAVDVPQLNLNLHSKHPSREVSFKDVDMEDVNVNEKEEKEYVSKEEYD